MLSAMLANISWPTTSVGSIVATVHSGGKLLRALDTGAW